MDKTLRKKYELKTEELTRYKCNPNEFKFETVKYPEPGLESVIIGQEKGVEAIKEGLETQSRFHNIFVTGPAGTGKDTILRTMIKQYIENMPLEQYKERIAEKKDLVAVYNFENPNKPTILELPAGESKEFQKHMETATNRVLIQEIQNYKQNLQQPKEALIKKVGVLENTLKLERNSLQAQARKLKLEHNRINKELSTIDSKSPERKKYEDGLEEINQSLLKLEDLFIQTEKKEYDQKLEFQNHYLEAEKGLQEAHMKNITPIINEVRQDYANLEKIKNLEKKVLHAEEQILILNNKRRKKGLSYNEKRIRIKRGIELKKLEREYKTAIKIQEYLNSIEEELKKDSKELIEEILQGREGQGGVIILGLGPQPQPRNAQSDEQLKYKVNLLSKSDLDEGIQRIRGIPLIFETKPTLENLFGVSRPPQELVMHDGSIITKKNQHTRIKAGSLVKANGGYLVMNIIDLLLDSYDDGFRRLIKDLERGKTSMGQKLPFYFSLENVESEDVDLNVKVILTGTDRVYRILNSFYEEFNKTFNIKAELDSTTKNIETIRNQYSRHLINFCDEKGLKSVTPEGIAEIINHSVRLAGNQNKLTTNLDKIKNLVREANEEAKNSDRITAEHVKKAIETKRARHNLLERKVQEDITDGIRIIDTEGLLVGEVNVLVVYSTDIRFGAPTKLTVTTSTGKKGIISLDVEAGYAGSSFKKAIFSVQQNLKELFAQDQTISLDVGVSFEQNYGPIDGDSATLAKFLALVSKLSNMPIDQELAVTGSLNQKGKIVQPIGGVNEKIEGFYNICKEKGLTGDQGVIIPKINEKELMLCDQVIDSIKEGKFHIYSVSTPEEAIEILMGEKACEYDERGNKVFAQGTIYAKANKKIKYYNKIAMEKN